MLHVSRARSVSHVSVFTTHVTPNLGHVDKTTTTKTNGTVTKLTLYLVSSIPIKQAFKTWIC